MMTKPAIPDGGMALLREAQKQGAQNNKNAKFVEAVLFARPKEMSPNMGHGHHWFGNPESYLLVGDALGKAMIELIESDTRFDGSRKNQ